MRVWQHHSLSTFKLRVALGKVEGKKTDWMIEYIRTVADYDRLPAFVFALPTREDDN